MQKVESGKTFREVGGGENHEEGWGTELGSSRTGEKEAGSVRDTGREV